jgi:hypothetical protein
MTAPISLATPKSPKEDYCIFMNFNISLLSPLPCYCVAMQGPGKNNAGIQKNKIFGAASIIVFTNFL